jgi:hypothetical protein
MSLQDRTLCLLLLAAAGLVGCGRGGGLAPVSGTVTYRGQPVPGASVAFIPETVGALPASGLTDNTGRYELMTTVPGDGVPPGKYLVAITARGPDKPLPPGEASVVVGDAVPGDPLIPERYFQPDTSGLTAEVPAGGTTADFTLTESP